MRGFADEYTHVILSSRAKSQMPTGTWAYGLRMHGTIEDQPLAGFFWAGAGLGEVEGLTPADRELLDVYDRTLMVAMPLFDRKQEGVVSGYAASYDGPDVSLVLAALCDRVSALYPLLRHSAEACGAGDTGSATQAELSPTSIKFILTAIDEPLARAWTKTCDDLDFVQVHRGPIFDVNCDAVVSPANSFGFMDDGIDLLYCKYFGKQIELRLQELIAQHHHGELLVGTPEIVEEGDRGIPFIVAAPTMRASVCILIVQLCSWVSPS